MDRWFLGMHALWWVFWIVVIVALFSFAPPVPKERAGGSPLETLQQRHARGEIDTAEYEEPMGRLRMVRQLEAGERLRDVAEAIDLSTTTVRPPRRGSHFGHGRRGPDPMSRL